MSVKLNDSFTREFVKESELEYIAPQAEVALSLLKSKKGPGSDFIGWLDLPVSYDRDEYARIKDVAHRVRSMCGVFVVIGIGGSYLGARAAIEFVKSHNYNALAKNTPKIYFAGNTISPSALADILEICRDEDVCVNVISKSGTTTEPAVAFRIFRSILEEKYGTDGAKKRIFVTTDREHGTLKAFADRAGYETFVVPDYIGGRYSVLTSVGLLPIAVAGIDIDAMMAGAAASRDTFLREGADNDCLRYASLRNILYRKGKTTEILVGYEPSLALFAEWWKQLYGESEGKDGKGIYPSSVMFSTDLHSLGQYIQDGQRNIFETVLDIKTPSAIVTVPHDPDNIDGLNFLSGRTLGEINRTAMMGTLIAHADGGVPNIVIEANDMSAGSFGELVYFFELACAVSGYMLGVNPFDQPGVEAYKKNMFALLGKPGYEELRNALQKRL